MAEPRRHRFAPPEPGTAFGGLSWAQVAAVAAGLALGVWALRVLSGPAGLLAGLALAGAGFGAGLVSVGGRPLVGWAAVAGAFVWRAGRGQTSWRARAPQAGHDPRGLVTWDLPGELADLHILPAPAARGVIGVVADGGRLTGVLAARGGPFTLLDAEERDRRTAGFGQALGALARPGSPVARIGWVERTAPQSVDELSEHLAEHQALPDGHPALASYREVIRDAGPVARRHEVLIALTISCGRARRRTRGAQDHPGAADVLVRELAHLERRLRACEVEVEGALTPGLLARALRAGVDAAPARSGEGPPRESAGSAGPLAREEGWGVCRTDGSCHVTYWVAEWPRVEVGSDALAPLLLGTAARRAVSLVMEPLDPRRARRAVEAARTNEAGDDELRARMGFLATARRRRRQEAVEAEEQELADGHAAFRFAGYVTVSADGLAALEEACAEVEQAAQMARLELRRLWGEQALGLTFTLPLGRGLD